MNLLKFFFISIFLPLVCFANQTDTLLVRLNNGGRLKGEIILTNQQYLILKNENIGEKKIYWNEISFISSIEVYDSLQENKSFIVLPAPKIKKETFLENLSAEFMMGKGFNYERFIGFGVRANILISEIFELGATSIYHLGIQDVSSLDGYGALFLWGPEIGIRIDTKNFVFEPTLSFGEGTYQVGNEVSTNLYDIKYIDTSTKSDFYFSPGLGLKIKYYDMLIGVRFQYLAINNRNTFGLYISFGK
ncbi:MAG: hypothetical protein IPM32_10935 [Ignavibacteriae bacterium]|nr:hypothetical protein [Ignavibacteriota bacterium]